MAFGSPILSAVSKGFKGAYDAFASPMLGTWGPLLGGVKSDGMCSRAGHDEDLRRFTSSPPSHAGSFFGGLMSDDSPVPSDMGSCATSSPSYTFPIATAQIDLPAWCADATALSPSEDDLRGPDAAPKAEPIRKLRHTGNRRKKQSISAATAPASPELEGGAGDVIRSHVIDPYLNPIPANRLPLRQYVSAPELHAQRYSQAAPVQKAGETRVGGGLMASASMDDLLSELGWSSAQDYGSGGATSDAGPAVAQAAGNAPESGSLFQRRAAQGRDEMPAPAPIQTSNEASAVTSSSFTYPEPHTAESNIRQQQRRLEIEQIQAQYAATHAGSFGMPLLNDFVTPAAQHTGDESCEKTARTVQAALLFGSDAPERRNSVENLSVFGFPTDSNGRQYHAPQQQQQHPSASPYGGHYLLYSGGPATGPGFTSTFPPSSDPRTPRQRKQSMPAQQQQANSLQLEGVPSYAMRPQSSVTRGAAAETINPSTAFATPQQQRTYAATVPLMPVYLPPTDPMHQHQHQGPPWSAPRPSSSASSHPGSGGSTHTYASLPSTTHTSQGYASVQQTPVKLEPQQQRTMPKTPTSASSSMAKKARSTPNLRNTPPSSADVTPASSSSAGGSSGARHASPTTPTRKIATNRRVQSNKDLRGSAGLGSPIGLHKRKAASGSAGSGSAAAEMAAVMGEGVDPWAPAPGGFSFVNYGVEDAQELCAAVAPSGSTKIPLKGYVAKEGQGASGATATTATSASSSSAGHSHSGGLPHKAPSAAIKSKPRPKATVDNSRWIQETGEETDDEDDDSDGEDFDDSGAGASPAKKRKSIGGASGTGVGASPAKKATPRRKAGVS